MGKNLLRILPLAAIGIGVVLASCNNTSTKDDQPKQTAFKQPVTVPLTFSKPTTIDWAAINDVKVKPVVKKIDLDKIPAEPYVSNGLKAAPYDMDEVKFDYNSLPQKDLDIDQLPSKPLKFKTIKLPPPKLIKSGPPRLKDTILSLYNFGEAQGLPDLIVSYLFNDRDGFLWIGTTKGIYRYDGENLLLYVAAKYKDPHYMHYILGMLQDQQGRIWIEVQREGLEILDPIEGTLKKTNTAMGLGNNNSFKIIQDEQQRIWISGYPPGGVNIIDPKTQTIKWLNKRLGLSDTSEFGGIIKDKDNKIWIATYKGLNVIDLKNKKIRYLDQGHGLKSDSVDQVMTDLKGNIYIACLGGSINILNTQTGVLQSFKMALPPRTDMFSLMHDEKGRIWVATTTIGVETIATGRRTISNLSTTGGLTYNYVNNIARDSRGQVWIATQNGLNMIGNKEAIVEHIGEVPTTAVAEDGQGLIWQCSLYNGVNIIDRKVQTIRHFDTNNGLGNDTMNFVKAINGRLFIGNSSGLDIIDASRKTLTHLGKTEGFSNTSLVSVIVDKAGKIWLGGNNAIDVYDPRSNTYKHLGRMQGLGDTVIADMNIDLHGKIWLSSYPGGVTEIDPSSGVIKTITNTLLETTDQRVLQPDYAGNMWIGALQGLYFADIKNQKLTSFSTEQGLPDEGVLSVQKYKNRIYAGTGKGISVITPPDTGINGDKNWKVESFDKRYGLAKIEPGYETDALTHEGLYLWGDKGLTVLDLNKKDRYIPPAYITTINIMDQPKFFAGRDRTSSNGLTWDKAAGPFNMPDNLHLPYNQNYLRFNYGSLNLADRDTILYKYKLVGVDQNWSSESNANVSRNYFNMSPGEYTFKVITKSSDAGWSKPALLTFTINPPWWQTWWAYVLYAALIGGSIWGFSHYRSLQLIKEKRILEHKIHLRTEEVLQQKEEIEAQRDDLKKAFGELKSTQTQLVQSEKMASLGELTAGIAHEIQNPLNFVNNFSDVNREMLLELEEELDKGEIAEAKIIAADIRQNEEKINHHGKRADAIVKGMLQHSRTTSGEKEPTNINALAEEYLRLAFHGLRAKDKSFNAEMITNFDPELPKVKVIPQDIGRVLLNLFNNAFYAVNQKSKTAGVDYKPMVEVTTFTPPSGGLGVKVKDNGVGIPDEIKDKIMQPFFTTKPTGEGTGLGLSLTYDMVVKGHGGSISVDTKQGSYTEFTVSLPE